MDNKQYTILIIKKPNFIGSLLEDTFTFGGFIAVLWFNHAHLNGNAWIDVLFIIGWVMTAASMQSRRNKRVGSVREAISWLQEQS
jgi:hypothetical protein